MTPTTITCPFIAGPAITAPAQFYGRHTELRQLASRVGGISAQSFSIVGERRMGKSSLLWQVVNRAHLPATSPYRLFHTTYDYVVIYLDLSGACGRSNRTLMDKLRHELTRANLPSWDKADNGDLATLSYALEDIQRDNPNTRLVLCLDEFEAINQHPDEFDHLLEALRSEATNSRVALVTASRTPLKALCEQGRKPHQTSAFYNVFSQCQLAPFRRAEWHELVLSQMPQATPDDLAFIERCGQGYPFLTQLAAQILWSYWPVTDYNEVTRLFRMEAQSHLPELYKGWSPSHLIIYLYDYWPDLYHRLTPQTQREDILRWLTK